jgi:hypothetical protein
LLEQIKRERPTHTGWLFSFAKDLIIAAVHLAAISFDFLHGLNIL